MCARLAAHTILRTGDRLVRRKGDVEEDRARRWASLKRKARQPYSLGSLYEQPNAEICPTY